MNNRIKAYVFDVDGTLLKSDGKTLQKGVPEIMKKIYATRQPVLFVSGKNYGEVSAVAQQICDEANIPREMFDLTIASNNGGFIGKVNKRQEIKKEQMDLIRKTVSKIDPKAVFVYKTIDSNYVETARDGEATMTTKIKKASMRTLAEIMIRANKFDLKLTPIIKFSLNNLEKTGCILSLNILSLNKSDEITQALYKSVPELYALSNSNYVEISVQSKYDIVQDFLNRFDDKVRIKHVAYFGDSKNDERSLVASGIGFLCNVSPKKYDLFKNITSLQNKYAIDDFSNPEVIKAITGRDYDENKLQELTKKVEARMKTPKENKKTEQRAF